MIINYPLTIEDFRTWLESKEEDETVGVVRNSESCPIATVLKESYKEVNVDYKTTATQIEKWITYTNPDWVEEFTRRVDYYNVSGAEVSAKKALEVLYEIEEGL